MEKKKSIALFFAVFLFLLVILLLFEKDFTHYSGIPIILHFLVLFISGGYLFSKVSESKKNRKMNIFLFFLLFLTLFFIFSFLLFVFPPICTIAHCPCPETNNGEFDDGILQFFSYVFWDEMSPGVYGRVCNSCGNNPVFLITGVLNVFRVCSNREVVVCDTNFEPVRKEIKLKRSNCKFSVYIFGKNIYGPRV